MEVEKISELLIKPSSPTPFHLKTYKISLLDQFYAQSLDIPMILHYSNKDIDLSSKLSTLLKQSLSETLTRYYPLAGRIKDSLSVDCNDQGVRYVVAKANISLAEYLSQPDLPSLNGLLPFGDKSYGLDTARSYVIMIQETIFECGSIAIGVLARHMVMDGITIVSFLKCWAAITRNSTKDVISPNMEGPSIFPQLEAYPKDANSSFPGPFVRIGKLTTRRFVFDAVSIANLKAKSTTSSVENPTRVEVVSAVLLESIAAILKERSSGIDKALAFTHAVSLRQRAMPPIPKNFLGNFLHLAPALCSPEEIKIGELAYKQREAIRKIDSDFVENLKSEGFNKLHEMLNEVFGDLSTGSSPYSKIGVNFVFMSSWCNFGLYEVDFGWGKPSWVSFTAFPSPNSSTPFINLIVLMDAAVDKGIEAWVIMDEEESLLLEKHEHLLQYASLNPNPLKLCN